MAKAKISASDFLAAIVGETVEHNVPGVGIVTIRSLDAVLGKRLFETYAKDEGELFAQIVRHGLVEPQLSDDDLAALRAAKAGPIMKLATAIMQLSGMSDDETMAGEAGGGS